MTESITCEFDHNNSTPKKTTRSTEELDDGFSGLPSSEDEDGLSGLTSYGDKGGILEDGFADKGKKKWRIFETGRLRDPLVVLGPDIMLVIVSCLDARSVALCLLVSFEWRAVASSDRIWSSKCEELWQGKAHLPRIVKVNGLSKLAAYSLSVKDGNRKRITKEELCDHVWEFHFTQRLLRRLPSIGECSIPTGMEQDLPCTAISFQMEVRLQNQMTGYGVVTSLATL